MMFHEKEEIVNRFFAAVKSKNLAVVRGLLNARPFLASVRNGNGLTALDLAVELNKTSDYTDMFAFLYAHRNSMHVLMHNIAYASMLTPAKSSTTGQEKKCRRERVAARNAVVKARVETAVFRRENGFDPMPVKRMRNLFANNKYTYSNDHQRNQDQNQGVGRKKKGGKAKALPTLAPEVRVTRSFDLNDFIRDTDEERSDDDGTDQWLSEDDGSCDGSVVKSIAEYTDVGGCYTTEPSMSSDDLDDAGADANENRLVARTADSKSESASRASLSSMTTSEADVPAAVAGHRPSSPSAASSMSSAWDMVSKASSLGSDWELVSPALPSSHSICGESSENESISEEVDVETGSERNDDNGGACGDNHHDDEVGPATQTALLFGNSNSNNNGDANDDDHQAFNDDFFRPSREALGAAPRNPARGSYAQALLARTRAAVSSSCTAIDSTRTSAQPNASLRSVSGRASPRPHLFRTSASCVVGTLDSSEYECSCLTYHDLDAERDKERDRRFGKMNRSRAGKSSGRSRKHTGHDGSGMSRIARKTRLTVID